MLINKMKKKQIHSIAWRFKILPANELTTL